MNKIWLFIRRVGVELYAFFTTPFVLRNCLGAVGFIAGFLLLSSWWLTCYTDHGESVEVPVLTDMSFREASRKARGQGFSVAISDSIFVSGKPPQEVIDQNPKPGSRVKENRTIYFTISKNNPDMIKLPGLAGGDDYDLYSRKLSRLGLKLRILARVANPKLSPNTIVSVIYNGDTITNRLSYGVTIPMGSTVDFLVSEAVTLSVNIPDCLCKTLDEAKFLLQTSEINIGSTIPDATVTDPDNAYIWRQNPPYDPNGIMRKGEQIDLWLTQQKPKSCPN